MARVKRITVPPKADEPKPDAMDAQFGLPLNEQVKLMVVPPTLRPDEELIRAASQLARSARIPLWGINLIPTKNGIKPYINADGIKFRLANDERGVSSNTADVLQFPTGNGSLAVVKRTITLRNGQVYQGLGAVVVDSQWNPANSLLKADTKANRRAGYDAIASAVGLPMYDEDADRSNGSEVVEGEFRAVVHAPRTIGQFLAWMTKEGISDERFQEVIGFEVSLLREADVREAWEKLSSGGAGRPAS